MYDQLLFATGGGIISDVQKDEQWQCATLVIGLGGIGIDCIRRLKRQVYEDLKPDNPDEQEPEYSHIRFLAVDTDVNSMSGDGMVNRLDESTEYLMISDPQLPSREYLEDHPALAWFDADRLADEGYYQMYMTPDGARGVRQGGRVCMILKSQEFLNKVRDLLMAAKSGYNWGTDINVHIFSGLGGGTGSGIFLDVCYIVQKALDDLGEGTVAKIFGYFVLPDVFLNKSSMREIDGNSRKYMEANSYAAMKELDYCMNFDTNGGSWEQQYCGFSVGPTQRPPVHYCHLISAAVMGGVGAVCDYDFVINSVCEYVMQFLVRSGRYGENLIPDNAMRHLYNENGAEHMYIAPGASKVAVPGREIMTCLGSILFESFSRIREFSPNDAEVDEFSEQIGISFKRLLGQVMQNTSFEILPPQLQEIDYRSFFTEEGYAVQSELNIPYEIEEMFRYEIERITFTAEHNIFCLLDDSFDWRQALNQYAGEHSSVVWKAFSVLEQLVGDSARGPYYAARVLKGRGENSLVMQLYKTLEQIQRLLHMQIPSDMQYRRRDIKHVVELYSHPTIMEKLSGNRQRRFNELILEVSEYYRLIARKNVLERMERMVRTMIGQFESLYSNCFMRFCDVYDNLLRTFRENEYVVCCGKGRLRPDDANIAFIPSPDDRLKDELGERVRFINPRYATGVFNSYFFKNVNWWTSENESRIVKFVSYYVNNMFSDYRDKKLMQYLAALYQTTNAVDLADRLYDDYLIRLNILASPLFRNGDLHTPVQRTNGYLFIPNSEAVIQAAADRLTLSDPAIQYFGRVSSNKITMVRFLCGVPMPGFSGVQYYRKAYEHALAYYPAGAGIHIYEGTERDERDWWKLPDICEPD